MTVDLYAEHLANIRTLSIHVSLPDAFNDRTAASISEDGSVLTVVHQNESSSIVLPVDGCTSIQDGQLSFPTTPSKDVNFRVQLCETSQLRDDLSIGASHEGNIVPWTGSTLGAESEISCARCKAVLVRRTRVQLWKDLPSENWAEMMDFWHCHRPHALRDDNHTTPRKGYNADSALAMHPGVGMTDATSFLCMAEDCQNLKIESTSSSNPSEMPVHCSSCRQQIGLVDSSTSGYKLRKLHLALSLRDSRPATSHDAEKWLACLLLSSSESQGVRKIRVCSTDGNREMLQIWIFTPDLWISTSNSSKAQPMRTMKAFWQKCASTARDNGALNRQALSELDIEIPDDELMMLESLLRAGTNLIPINARKFREWDVALLRRFTANDTDA